MKTVAISGGMDPLHIGHIRYIKAAKKLGDYLIVILNNDNWLTEKKGKPFMNQEERREILENIKGVDYVYMSLHEPHPIDMSVAQELKLLKPNIFANGGDRLPKNTPEIGMCEQLNIEMAYGVGGEKVQSSSTLIKNAI